VKAGTFRFLCLLLVAGLAGSGCQKSRSINHYRAGDYELAEVSRVVFVELSEDIGYPDIAERMTVSLQEELLQRGLFRVDVLQEDHPELRDLDLEKRDPYTIAELAAIRKTLRCDAVLFGKMVQYRPYPGTQIGLYLRLVDLKDGKLLWAVDDIWDTTDRNTYRRIKNFYVDEMRETYDPAKAEMGVMSTEGFQKFVAFEVADTICSPEMANRSGQNCSRPFRRFMRHQKQVTKDVIADY
jgi:hypothetical protein